MGTLPYNNISKVLSPLNTVKNAINMHMLTPIFILRIHGAYETKQVALYKVMFSLILCHCRNGIASNRKHLPINRHLLKAIKEPYVYAY